MLTTMQLKQVMPHLGDAKAELYLPPLNQAMQRFAVDTVLRAAAFVAQLAHESGEFRFMEEIWGPTDAQRRYEGRADLGNVQPGDGKRYKGRGPIQITGRANYRKYGGLLGVDLVANPERAAEPDAAFLVAGLFWASNHLNELADAEQFVLITKRINGGTNGLADRQMYYERAKHVLAGAFGDASAAPPTRGIPGLGLPAETPPAPPASPLLDDLVPLMRGAEALREMENEATDAAVAPTTPRRAARKGASRKAATKAPAAKTASSRRATRKSAAKQTSAKKAAGAKKKGASAKKVAAGKAAAKKSAARKAPAKRAAGSAARKAPSAKKAVASKNAGAKGAKGAKGTGQR